MQQTHGLRLQASSVLLNESNKSVNNYYTHMHEVRTNLTIPRKNYSF